MYRIFDKHIATAVLTPIDINIYYRLTFTGTYGRSF
jgi:hypothetical protein